MMAEYKESEKKLANFLNSIPFVKKNLKYFYQLINYFFYKKGYFIRSAFKIQEVSNKASEVFFGYYDKSPENETGQFLIYQQSERISKKKPSPNSPVHIILKNKRNGNEKIIGESHSYNWQQGTKLQWIDKNEFIYNFYDHAEDTYKSRIYDALNSNEISLLDSPIYDCYKKEYALTLNFARLSKLRPDYGYRNRKIKTDINNIEQDGIFYVDIANNTAHLIISLQQLVKIDTRSSMSGARHKVNHIMISPDGQRFIFLHRWFINGGKRFDRLLVSDKNGKSIKILVDQDMVSHCCWYDKDTIIGYFRHNSYGDSFYKIDVHTSNVQLLSEKLLGLGDGHPSVCNDLMVFDSYPDRSRMKKLFIYYFKDDTLKQIGEFFESLKYFGETRCDLHPKWNFDGSKIFIDSVHEGKRKLYDIQFSE
ncbi:MAG: hypothetical protein ACOCP4_04205 [Candidatus Woesearchaeota archaeon]